MGKCLIWPNSRHNGKKSILFKELSSLGDRSFQNKWWGKANNFEAFSAKYKNFKVDDNGEPTLYTMLYKAGGINETTEDKLINFLRQSTNTAEDNTATKSQIIDECINFNEHSEFAERFFATPTIDEDKDGNEYHTILFTPISSREEVRDQRMQMRKNQVLNKKLREYMIKYGVEEQHIDTLQRELKENGSIQFNNEAEQSVKGIAAIINLARGVKGEEALGEEYAHFAIAAMANKNLKDRLINVLKNEDILKAIFQDQYEDYLDKYNGDLDTMAEEALGKLVKTTFLDSQEGEYNSNLYDRFVNSIKQNLSKLDREDLIDLIDQTLKEVKDLGERISKDQEELAVDSIDTNHKLYQLTISIEDQKKKIEQMLDVEQKRLQLSKHSSAAFRKALQNEITKLQGFAQGNTENDINTGPLRGFLVHSSWQIKGMKNTYDFLKQLQEKFKNNGMTRDDILTIASQAAGVRTISKAYMRMTADMLDFLAEQTSSIPEVQSIIEQTRANLGEMLVLLHSMETSANQLAKPAIQKVLEEFVGDGITIDIGAQKYRGKWTAKQIMEELDRDEGPVSMFIDSLANSTDPLLKVVDQIIKREKNDNNRDSLAIKNKITMLYVDLTTSTGSKDQSFMYEVDKDGKLTGNLVKEDSDQFKNTIANNSARLAYYKGMMEIFKNAKEKIPEYFRHDLRAPQMSQSFLQRMSKGGLGFIKSTIQEKFQITDKDADQFTSVLTDINGDTVRTVPVYYVNKLSDMNDLSTDLASTLLAFSDMAGNYSRMHKVANITSMMADTLAVSRQVHQRNGIGDRIYNLVNGEKRETTFSFKESNSYQKLQAILNAQVYGRMKKDEGGITLMGKYYSFAKMADGLNYLTSLTTTAASLYTGSANLIQNAILVRLEASAGQIFNRSDLFYADKMFARDTPGYIAEAGGLIHKNKLRLFNDYFNVLQDVQLGIKDADFRRTKIGRSLFNMGTLYLPTSAGDFYTQSRVGLAVASNTKLKDANGNAITLYDAYEVVATDPNNPNTTYQLKLKEGVTKLDGTAWTDKDTNRITNKIRGSQNRLFGIYNQYDKAIIDQFALGRLVMLYRGWMRPMWLARFGKVQLDMDLGMETEGYFMTTGRFMLAVMKDMRHFQFNILSHWHELSAYEKSNVIRSAKEIGIYVALSILAACFFGSDADDSSKDSWFLSMLTYSLLRLKSDMGTMIPSPQIVDEASNVISSPFGAYSLVSNILGLFKLFNPSSYEEEINAGPYAGFTKAEAAILKVTPGGPQAVKIVDPSQPANRFK